MLRSESITKISIALLKAQKEMINPKKDKKNPFFKSDYVSLNAVLEACLEALNENCISLIQPTTSHDGKNFVETLLLHESGEFIGSETEIKNVKGNDPQAEGSGISYARRYGLQSLLSLTANDDDAEKAMGRTQSNSKSTQPVKKDPETFNLYQVTDSEKIRSISTKYEIALKETAKKGHTAYLVYVESCQKAKESLVNKDWWNNLVAKYKPEFKAPSTAPVPVLDSDFIPA